MRLGLIGAGAIAYEHARAILALGHEVALVSALSERSPRWEKLKSLCPDAGFAAGAAEVLQSPRTDAIVACLPWNVTEGRLEDLLSCPKPVLIEKPVALSLTALQGAVDRHRGTLANKRVGYNRRFYEPALRLRERIEQGGLRSAEVTISEDIENHVKRHGPEIVPHLMLFSSHALDLALFLLGPLNLLKTYPKKERGFPFVSCHALLETAGGAPVWLSSNADDPCPVGIRCRFEDGTAWHLAPLETLRVYQGFEIAAADPKTNIRRYSPVLKEEVQADSKLKPGLLAQMRGFLAQESAVGATVEQSLPLISLAQALTAAS
ncbi:MAG: Gfo/Idh/MocA family oxidoreductase [Elusimicrobia bacterium]|nr:Gfo/Idh/MocA family oxidoreductase [Elusimicrobiota bacterium]